MRYGPPAAAGFVLLLGLHVALRYFAAAWAGGVFAAALLAVALLTAAACGRMLLRAFGVRGASESERSLLGATLGLGLLSQGLFLLGLAGWLKAWAVTFLLGTFWVIGFPELRLLLESLKGNLGLLRDRPWLAGGTAAALGVLFWLTWAPPHQYDALVYHLPLAAAYVRQGSIHAVPHLLYTHFPQNGEMLYALGLLLGSDALAQMFTWTGTFLSVWWLLELGKRELPLTSVLLACLMTVTHTAVMLLTPIAYVECLVMLWVTASVLSLLRWAARPEEGGRGWLALAGVFAGLGVGTKYYAGICPALCGLLLLGRWLAARPWAGGARERLKDGLVYAACAAAAGAPWLLKNLWTVGNPVFPFLYRLLPPRGVAGWDAESARRYFDILTEYGVSKSAFFKELLQFPYLAAVGSQRYGGGADVLGDLGWAALFACLPAALWAARRTRWLLWVLAYCAGHWAAWFSTGVVLRFLTVIVPLLSLPAAHGLYKLWEALRGGRAALAAGAAALLAANLALFLYVHAVVETLPVLVGLKSRGEYLTGKLDYYACAAFARERLPRNDRILVVGEQRGYYLRQPHVTTAITAPNPFVEEANRAAGPEDLARRLRERLGVGYLLVAPREARRLAPYGAFAFTEEGRRSWDALEEGRLEPVFESPGRCALYRVL